ncbi:BgTH12-07778 [Blumeria graminis f. sp. triticale]|uniref:BgtA-21046 n=3 Tax=Blumeria graminis TaxID=34373 RepID=A0A9X9MPU6_BLUGR|nr:hypothetical protein BGT96224_A21046 [Blumeria graminis f. sp. tritici 96224]CAD6506551.1 BgTH12-07778 [Blumeria graminis f. sp. triticale]VDB96409.1 BgtA-21046 [Blumeria graminis f. sp. tritici]
MSVSWDTLKTLTLFFGPILLPKLVGYYRAYKYELSKPHSAVRPVPKPVLGALFILFSTSCYLLVLTLPYFSPEEIFTLTSSRLQIPVDVLFNRLAALRPSGLTETDLLFKSKIVSTDSRLLYLQYGKPTIMNCTFCSPDDPKSYFYYALPILITPHLLNLFVLEFSTSSFFTNRDGKVWRTRANIAAMVLGAIDIYRVFNYPFLKNARVTTLDNIEFFFWTSRLQRLLALAILDSTIGWVMYLSSTRRAFFDSSTALDHMESLQYALNVVQSKLTALEVLKNTIVQDNDLRDQNNRHWMNEIERTSEILEDESVVAAIALAKQSRVDMKTVKKDADNYSRHIMSGFQEMAGSSATSKQ